MLDVRSQAPPGVLRGPPRSLVVPHQAEREHMVSTSPGPRAADGVAAVPVPGRPSFMSMSAGFLLLLTSFFDMMICSGDWFLSFSEIFFKCI